VRDNNEDHSKGEAMSRVNIGKLKEIVGENNVRDDAADLYVYGSDSSVHSALPHAIVRPMTIEQVQAIMRYANSEKIPVIPRGSGSGMCGQVVPVNGGIILDMKGLNRILEINPQDGYCRVEPGVVDDDLNRALDQVRRRTRRNSGRESSHGQRRSVFVRLVDARISVGLCA
jgi:glycolate oxidase